MICISGRPDLAALIMSCARRERSKGGDEALLVDLGIHQRLGFKPSSLANLNCFSDAEQTALQKLRSGLSLSFIAASSNNL